MTNSRISLFKANKGLSDFALWLNGMLLMQLMVVTIARSYLHVLANKQAHPRYIQSNIYMMCFYIQYLC